MAGNSFGELFRITSYGESHGMGIGVVIDGCPAGLKVDLDLIQKDLDRRRPGQSAIVTDRKESDKVIVQSGIFEGVTTGMPIALFVQNKDQRSKDYGNIKESFRPSHADMTYTEKYGVRDYRGGGRSSARETVARVAAGAIAKQLLSAQGISIHAGVTQVGSTTLDTDPDKINWDLTESNIVRCPDTATAKVIQTMLEKIKAEGNTVGGRITAYITGCPPGLGEPVFDKLHADLGKAMMSINAVKGFEYGSGFSGISMKGSEHNDEWTIEDGKRVTTTNRSGGIQGGISNGMPIYFNVAFKPVATIKSEQETINASDEKIKMKVEGRHDPCVVPRAVPIVEAMAALVLADHFLRNKVSKI